MRTTKRKWRRHRSTCLVKASSLSSQCCPRSGPRQRAGPCSRVRVESVFGGQKRAAAGTERNPSSTSTRRNQAGDRGDGRECFSLSQCVYSVRTNVLVTKRNGSRPRWPGFVSSSFCLTRTGTPSRRSRFSSAFCVHVVGLTR